MRLFNWFKPAPPPALKSEAEAERERLVLEQKRKAELALAPFIPGQFSYWCDKCFGVVSTMGVRHGECPRCEAPIRLVAAALRHPAPIETAKKRKVEQADPKKRNDLLILTSWKDPMDAA